MQGSNSKEGDPSHEELLSQEMQSLLQMGTVQEIHQLEREGVLLLIFPNPRAKRGLCPILDLCHLNKYLKKLRFHMVSLASIIPSLDLGDCLSAVPWVFTKYMAMVAAFLRRQGIQVYLYLNGWLIKGRSEAQVKISIKFTRFIFEKWGSPQIDLFAIKQNRKSHQFCSFYGRSLGSLSDTFLLPWTKLLFYMFPPVLLVHKVLLKNKWNKVAFLVAITSARRVSEIKALMLEPLYMVFFKDQVQMCPHLAFLLKFLANESEPLVLVPPSPGESMVKYSIRIPSENKRDVIDELQMLKDITDHLNELVHTMEYVYAKKVEEEEEEEEEEEKESSIESLEDMTTFLLCFSSVTTQLETAFEEEKQILESLLKWFGKAVQQMEELGEDELVPDWQLPLADKDITNNIAKLVQRFQKLEELKGRVQDLPKSIQIPTAKQCALRTHCSTPAECLRQMRCRPRRNKEDMFCEVLQSTDVAHSETRAWRKTINERLRLDSQERTHRQEQMIKLLEGQTEMLKSLFNLYSEHIHFRPSLEPLQNSGPCSPQTPHCILHRFPVPHSTPCTTCLWSVFPMKAGATSSCECPNHKTILRHVPFDQKFVFDPVIKLESLKLNESLFVKYIHTYIHRLC
ncbi:uncharacterized protein CCDC7 [Emydura macquarii macquarii]|uniref:uncharacterized protein CCDC7 n=1 Tax=Emydura macquarii macquarii TaxID=1129001 RepID=UPI00352A2ED9